MIAVLALSLALQQQPAAAAPAAPAAQAADSFPHAAHRRLFTTCATCHAGIPAGDRATSFPDPLMCRNCHDGQTQRVVYWTPRAEPRPTTLAFTHPAHARASADMEGDSGLTCTGCHALADRSAGLMAVGRARPETCIECHTGRPVPHLAQASCAPCHRAASAQAQMAAGGTMLKPPSHVAGYDLAHARDARASAGTCAVCHSREFCATCHPNAAQVDVIRGMPSSPQAAAALQGRAVTYHAPATHAAADFLRSHGPAVRQDGVARCANCHTRESCLECHRDQSRVREIAQLPRRSRTGAPGVQLAGRRPDDHTPDFLLQHRTAAAGGDASCARCHTATFCSSCHDAVRAPASFHGFNYVQRHGQSALTPDAECASCHQTQAFCVRCHQQVGISSTQARGNRFHDRGGFWLLGHGAAARRSLETCTTCHSQQFCMACHSARAGWRVNPHGPGFDPSIGDRNPNMCRNCHPSGPPSR